MDIEMTLPQSENVSISRHVRILSTDLWCRGCDTAPKKYIDTTPGEMLCKYLCNCVDEQGEATEPKFPLFKRRGNQ